MAVLCVQRAPALHLISVDFEVDVESDPGDLELFEGAGILEMQADPSAGATLASIFPVHQPQSINIILPHTQPCTKY